ncbi:FAD-binding protein [Pseudorhodoplanes sp.]|uniref:FAD-binding protein n=1 Tax=Pseudorhodoplanes sp. TaxID=1934341 RepID=UPI002CBDD998|nr:FAD-binding protein [Pseudorhodoplanes sp.]HWV41532.1 FAD-binding protein [Pseudorhodoplanes sp.]
MPDRLKPRDAKDVEDAVGWALAEGKTLEIVGQGSKRGIGRPSQSDVTLDLSALAGVTLYEPEELVLSARAGTAMNEIERLVAQANQELAFEPADYGLLLNGTLGHGTIGGVLASNLSGPRRIKAGAARDHFLGMSAVSGRGETFKSGGRVVKNVTGYDLCKLMAGSFGTLSVMTEVTIKTLPRAETETTVLLTGLDDQRAARAMTDAMGSSCDVSGAAHFPAAVAARMAELAGERPVTMFRLEGVAPSVAHRSRALTALLKGYGAAETIDAEMSKGLWRTIRDVRLFAGDSGPVWRVSTASTNGFAVASAAAQAGGTYFFDWAGGLIWIAMPPSDDAGNAVLRPAVAEAGGHATLIRAPAAIRAAVPVFDPQDAGVAALTQRVKTSFDPKGILNPGRMWPGV